MDASSVFAQPSESGKGMTEGKGSDKDKDKPELFWMVKPCFLYKEEYQDCKSFKARFHQYFIKGEVEDCSGWKQDFENCSKWEDRDDADALAKVLESEKNRVRQRLEAYYGNDVWESRKEPPADWNKELPPDIQKQYENTFLKLKADGLKAGTDVIGDPDKNKRGGGLLLDSEDSSLCSIV